MGVRGNNEIRGLHGFSGGWGEGEGWSGRLVLPWFWGPFLERPWKLGKITAQFLGPREKKKWWIIPWASSKT